MYILQEYTEALLAAGKEVVLEVIAEKTKYSFMSCLEDM
jgi:hypothetical protein